MTRGSSRTLPAARNEQLPLPRWLPRCDNCWPASEGRQPPDEYRARAFLDRPMDRSNPYEAAFEGYLKTQGLCYVGIDEGRRARLGELPVKNLDFIVLGACGSRLLVDVKGRRF